MEAVTLRLKISGRVQGVGYRAWTSRTAKAAGLSGWVRNRADGSVEALVQGSAVAVETFVAACHAGPPSARVMAVDTAPEAGLDAEAQPGVFLQLSTM